MFILLVIIGALYILFQALITLFVIGAVLMIGWHFAKFIFSAIGIGLLVVFGLLSIVAVIAL